MMQRVHDLEDAAVVRSDDKSPVEAKGVAHLPLPDAPRRAPHSLPARPAPPPSTGSKMQSILFDASKCSFLRLGSNNADVATDVPQPKPNRLENKHKVFIQTLFFIEKQSKDEIKKRTMEKFPDLYKEEGPRGTEEYRESMVSSNVELQTSKWATKVI